MSAEEIRRQADMFADHWHAATGKDGRKADWEATWRNWIRRASLPRPAHYGAQQSGQNKHAGANAAIFEGVNL